MNNLIGTFGPDLAQARMNEFVREAERVRSVTSTLKHRQELATVRDAHRRNRRRGIAILTPFTRTT